MARASSIRDPRRSSFLVVLVAIVGLALAFILGRVTSPEDRASPAPAETAPADAPTEEGKDEASAVAAATRFSQVMTGPAGEPSVYVDQMLAIAAPEWRKRARELAENAIDFVNERYGQGGSIEFEPMRFRVNSFSPGQAVVDLWGVVLASGPKIEGVEESWVTGTVELQFIGSEWKVTGQSSTGGPTPELLRTDEGGTIDEILNDFEEYPDAGA